jgi:hypothetical protein
MIARFWKVLSKWPSQKALLFACLVGLLALAVTALGIIMPKPIFVVLGMSLAQGLGGLAFALYGVTVLAEYKRDTGKLPPPPDAQPAAEPKVEQT